MTEEMQISLCIVLKGLFFFLCSLARGKKHYEGEMKPPSSGFMQFAISSF